MLYQMDLQVMQKHKPILHIKIELKSGLFLTIYPIGDKAKIYEINNSEADEFGEATIQVIEGRRYEYELSDSKYQLGKTKECIPSKSETNSRGTISPGNYVGTLELSVIGQGEKIPFYLEVLATKFNSNNDLDESYRHNYRSMIESITNKCTELLMQTNSPVNQNFEPDFNKDNKTIYQRFTFVRSVINSIEFEESILKIISSPKQNWISKEEPTDIRSIKRFSNRNVKSLIKGTNRIPLDSNHPLHNTLESIPSKIIDYKQAPSLDNPENRFIKHALKTYLSFCEKCIVVFKANSTKESKDIKEATFLRNKLEGFLSHSFFKEISRPTTLKLNSPTLQRKSGYREVLKSWLMYDLAAKLIWKGGEDVYGAGKRDIATLYEYWLFFILYDLFKDKFNLTSLEQESEPSYKHLIEKTKNGLNIIVKSGQHTALSGKVLIGNRELNIKYSFNRTFSGSKDSYPQEGSWTTAMRPDYTLTIWPSGVTETEAEKQELILHIHFDAKYKVDHFKIKSKNGNETITTEKEKEELDNIKKEERSGVYKNADLLKMHAYKDAIRRTGGAYILYPGDSQTVFKGFHELIPGLGAFSLNPANQEENITSLSNFIDEVIKHLVNRASQREIIAHKTYKIHDEEPKELCEPIPEFINGEKLIPDETYVLVGFSKDINSFKWYKKNGLYNFRMNDEKGSLVFKNEVVNAKYLLIRESGKSVATQLFKVKSGIRVFSREKLEELKHPSINKEHYLVIDFEKENISKEFENIKWDFKDLDDYKSTIERKNIRSAAGLPFTTTLTELMSVIKKD